MVVEFTINAPSIVATKALTGLTSALSETAVYTPKTSGLFRVSVALECVSSGASVSASVNWMDGFGSQGSGSVANFDGNGNITLRQETTSIRATSDGPISVSTNLSGGTVSYNLYATVEQLA